MASWYIHVGIVVIVDHVLDWMNDPKVAEFKQDSEKVNPQYKEPVRTYDDGMDTGGNTVN